MLELNYTHTPRIYVKSKNPERTSQNRKCKKRNAIAVNASPWPQLFAPSSLGPQLRPPQPLSVDMDVCMHEYARCQSQCPQTFQPNLISSNHHPHLHPHPHLHHHLEPEPEPEPESDHLPKKSTLRA